MKIEQAKATAAKSLSKYDIEFEAISDYLNILSKQENIQEAERIKSQLLLLKNKHENELRQSSLIVFNHACALLYLKKKEYERAIDLWRQNVGNKDIDKRQLDTNNRWLGIAYYENNDFGNARQYLVPYIGDIENAENHNALSAYLYVCKMDMVENAENIFENISMGLQKAKDTGDGYYIAEFEYLLGKYYKQKGEKELAEEYFIRAKDIFNKTDCFNKIKGVETEIAELV